ncbi:MAG: hypothetical protein HBSAPP03_18160 [Phycisphaerae bacterium]|nr:MAG: hypothetical protein HBSAPP03_18160 [Phycisphaerae bacterium]
MSFLDDAMQDKKKFYIQVGVIAVCLIGGIVAYVVISDGDAPPPAVDEAAARQQQIVDSMQPAPPPQEPPRTAPRGRIAHPGSK